MANGVENNSTIYECKSTWPCPAHLHSADRYIKTTDFRIECNKKRMTEAVG